MAKAYYGIQPRIERYPAVFAGAKASGNLKKENGVRVPRAVARGVASLKKAHIAGRVSSAVGRCSSLFWFTEPFCSDKIPRTPLAPL